jgi:hypothetical protein
MSSGLKISNVAFAAGMTAETIKIQHSTRSAQPAKKPKVLPKIILTHAYDVPACGALLLRLINANAIPNIMRPHTRTLAGERRPAVAIIVEVVISMLYAGAVPAIPMTIESTRPRELDARDLDSCFGSIMEVV